MACKGWLGIELDLDLLPQRETGMTAYEIMLSESQERMLMILRPGSEAEAGRIFAKWELDFAVIGRVTETGRLVVRETGESPPVTRAKRRVPPPRAYRRPGRGAVPDPETNRPLLPTGNRSACFRGLPARPPPPC